MNLTAVKKFLTDNKDNAEVQAYLGELSAVSADKVKRFLDTEDGKRLLQPRLDSYFTKGLETWKANNLEAMVAEEVAKRNPAQTEEQKRIAALEKALEDQKKEAQREKLMNLAMKQATEKQLPVDIVSFFLAEDEEKTTANLAKLEEAYREAVQAAVDSKFKENGRQINQGGGVGSSNIKSIQEMAAAHNIRNQQQNQ
ncbi:DUF4355 domain-containing protein [Cytobacillus oceanisediminis]|uniref:DUF4355 domain-containing protein n=1 Tax=Cytobacillus oceanisediminis TaxID=665099 RepID=UPI0020795D3C|nr:DUF4355 domain-containing protein [Cytobacillus oceanisediminis]USK47002.1 DUF4355 domain-containing protein [Cytobacillus oceanisediminis]